MESTIPSSVFFFLLGLLSLRESGWFQLPNALKYLWLYLCQDHSVLSFTSWCFASILIPFYLCRSSAWRFLWRLTDLEISSEKLLVLAYTLDFLWPSKETRWWRPITSIQHDTQCDGHECSLWGFKCCFSGGKKISLGDECCACQCSLYTSSHTRSRFCWCFAWLVSCWFHFLQKLCWLTWYLKLLSVYLRCTLFLRRQKKKNLRMTDSN